VSFGADGVINALTNADRIRVRRILVQLVCPPQREDEAATAKRRVSGAPSSRTRTCSPSWPAAGLSSEEHREAREGKRRAACAAPG